MEEKDIVTGQPENAEVSTNIVAEDVSKSKNMKAKKVGENKKAAEVAKKGKHKKKEETEAVSVVFGNLSDDEIYAKIQTEKLLRSKKTKRIATMAGMCFAFVLAVCVIILAAVPVSLKPACMDGGFASVTLFPGNTNGTSLEEGDDDYRDFMKVYNKSFSQSYISAIFSGSLFSYKIEEQADSVSGVIGSGGKLIQNNSYFVRLRYSQEQTFTYQNGKAYKSNYRNSKWDGKLTFSDVFFVVNQSKGFQETQVYVVAKYPKFEEGVQTGTNEYLITITVKANTYEIFDVWSDLT